MSVIASKGILSSRPCPHIGRRNDRPFRISDEGKPTAPAAVAQAAPPRSERKPRLVGKRAYEVEKLHDLRPSDCRTAQPEPLTLWKPPLRSRNLRYKLWCIRAGGSPAYRSVVACRRVKVRRQRFIVRCGCFATAVKIAADATRSPASVAWQDDRACPLAAALRLISPRHTVGEMSCDPTGETRSHRSSEKCSPDRSLTRPRPGETISTTRLRSGRVR
jgi:hypothetical protein